MEVLIFLDLRLFGGICGCFKGGTVYNCINYASVVSTNGNAAGIVGLMNGGEKIVKCTNYGEIISDRNQAAGIVAYQNSGTISECSNSGEISSSTYLAAGIVCVVDGSSEKVEKCSNSGKVTAGTQQAGGIVGHIKSGVITDCYNTEEISAGAHYCGGICAWMSGEAETVKNCINYGKVTSTTYGAGGIVSRQDSGTVSECSNIGEISTGTYGCGGIVSFMQNSIQRVEKCSNSGKVSAGTNQAGGIAGLQYAGTISECINEGNITSKCDGNRGISGGIVGWFNGESAEINKVFNNGTISSEDFTGSDPEINYNDIVGGIVGKIDISKENAITYAYNKGELIGGDENCVGAVVGENNTSNSVSNCYYYFETESSIPGIGGTTATEEGNYLTGTTRSYTNYPSLKDFLNGERIE